MTARHSLWPTRWLMTDERIGERLWPAIGRLPAGGGIVFRHYGLGADERRRLAERVAADCRDRGLVLAVAGDEALARAVGAALVHNPLEPGGLPFSRSVHSLREAMEAKAQGAALLFVSPVHATRSHPGQRQLGEAAAVEIAKAAGVPAIALGGMTEERFEGVAGAFHGWAGIDAWLA
ncbi:thiamine phosphate synthase [Sphingomonas sinipercae]|uniref:Thiamine phosphate synthase n=1 Tax=Sphingomonas sinipercae TaxID=2714944 RepID=A0A6G7ZKX2_9SPHN|nr:thiamine phosphate synthase [Sphingomonas sinipercae]QIL01568.1 thiamine phosphate synthase [Sphingomonas sinipercae]